jgi:hypothetical protein
MSIRAPTDNDFERVVVINNSICFCIYKPQNLAYIEILRDFSALSKESVELIRVAFDGIKNTGTVSLEYIVKNSRFRMTIAYRAGGGFPYYMSINTTSACWLSPDEIRKFLLVISQYPMCREDYQ